MQEPPRFSVVIPTHNGRASAKAAVESVLHQTYPHFEIIVVSDGEGDVTRQLLENLSDARLRVLEQPKRGSAAARNLGIREARNVWVALLDDDDLVRPHWLETWASLIRNDTLAATASVAKWRDGRQVGVRRCGLSLDDPTMGASTILAGGFAVRRDLLVAIGGYDLGLRAAQNQDLGLRLCDYVKSAGVAGVIASTDRIVADIFVEKADTRAARYGSARRDSATVFLNRYADRLSGDPKTEASLLRIISRYERLNGNPEAARASAFRAFRRDWANPKNARSAALSLWPGLERLLRRR